MDNLLKAMQQGMQNANINSDRAFVEVVEIRNSTLSIKELAKNYSISEPLVYKIKAREIWKHLK